MADCEERSNSFFDEIDEQDINQEVKNSMNKS